MVEGEKVGEACWGRAEGNVDAQKVVRVRAVSTSKMGVPELCSSLNTHLMEGDCSNLRLDDS